MSGRLVVKRYVNALVSAADDAGLIDSIERDMNVLSEIMMEKEIRDFCLKGSDSTKGEVEFVKTAFLPYVGDYTGRFIMLMAENRRIAALPFVKDAFDEIIEVKRGFTSVLLETAGEPDTDVVSSVEDSMNRYIGGRIVLRTSVNPSLLGGMRVSWRNRTLDMSLRKRFNMVRNIFKREKT